MTLCLCHVHIFGHTDMYSTGQCHMTGQRNAEINNDGCRQIQEPARHVRGSVSNDRSALAEDTSTDCAGVTVQE